MSKPLAPLTEILADADIGRLTLVREVEPIVRSGDGGRVRQALFRCVCGNQPILRVDNVKRGLTRSCGCFNIDVIRSRSR